MKSPLRLAVLAALCGTVVLAGWVAGGLADLGSPGTENTGAPTRATSVTARAEHVDAPQTTALGEDGVSVLGKDGVSVLGEDGVSVADMGSGATALPDPRPMPPPATPPTPAVPPPG